MVIGLEEGTFQEDKPQCESAYQAPNFSILANGPLAKLSHGQALSQRGRLYVGLNLGRCALVGGHQINSNRHYVTIVGLTSIIFFPLRLITKLNN